MARLSATLDGYRTVLRTPGIARLSGSGAAVGIAAQGSPVALVLLGREATGSFARAGALLAAATAGGLVFSPARARLVDRRGATRILPLLAVANAAGLVALALAAHRHAPLGLLVALAFAQAACLPPVGAVMRSLWRDLLPDGSARHAGFGLMTVLQEVTFFTGPLVAGAVLALASAEAAVITLAGLALAGTLAFATAPATKALTAGEPNAARSSWLGALAMPGMRTVAATAAFAGAAFGMLDVALPAVARHEGSAGAAGLLLSAIALGIGVGGFAYGLRPPRRRPGELYGPLFGLAALGLAPLVLAYEAPLPALAALLVITGFLFAPVTTCQFALIDDVVPRAMATEAVAVLGVAYGGCSALGAQLAGALVDGPGLRAPFVAAFAAAAVAALVATARRRSMLRAPATIETA
jgi:MFS family permease